MMAASHYKLSLLQSVSCSLQKTASTVCQQVWQGKAGSQLILRQEESNKIVNLVKSETGNSGHNVDMSLRLR